MPRVYSELVLLALLIIPLVSLLLWQIARMRRQGTETNMGTSDSLLLAMLALAAFGLGAFVAFVVMGVVR